MTWRIIATIGTFIIAYWLTGSTALAVSIGVVDFVVKTILFIIHEKVWETTKWGLNRKKKRH